MTRTAFRATLEISNHDPGSPLNSVSAQVEIKDAAGQVANSLFQIEDPTLDGIDSVGGSGTIAANGKATIRWLLIPKDVAAPTTATEFFVGGQFSYTLGGNQALVPLEAVKITVHPDAALELTYFHQRDVFSDDPFTPEVEPAQPYALAVMVKNRGAGAANSLKITSGDPQVVSNDKGLVIDFKLVGTSLDGTNIANALSLDFGRIEPGAIKAAQWLFTSSLQGFFRDFKATFQHEDSLGNIHLSTIKSVSIHEMTHIVEAGYQFADGKVDYLVNDTPDPDSLPDTLYLSDGSTNQVQPVLQGAFDGVPSAGNLQVQLTAPMPSGWGYLRLPEPSDGHLVLTGVRRSDGVQIKLGTNAWTTDRTFVGAGLRPLVANTFHLLDYGGPGIYTLTYSLPRAADLVAPVSLVAVLPAGSPINFPVQWSGQDSGSGIAYYDIFVSTNGGPFQVWLAHTVLSGAIFSGIQSNTYAFYSVATDVAGNRESAPGSPDAQTTISIINHTPSFTGITDLSVNEGEEFVLTLTATDADLPNDTLTYGLGAGAPGGMTINPTSGRISWLTTEAHGPSTNVITVNVHDNGNPVLTDSRTFRLIVNEVNSKPTLAPIASRTINEGQQLWITNSASDSDLPAQILSYTLGPGAPTGASIDSATGIFSWKPSEFQGGTTNTISVIVSDSWTPSLSATQSFSVVVRDVLSDFAISVGTTNLLAGASNAVRLQLASGADLKHISFLVSASEDRLTNFVLRPTAPEVSSSSLQRIGAGRFQAEIETSPGQTLLGRIMMAELGFQAVSNNHSAIVPIVVSAVDGLRENGTALDNGQGSEGRVFVIGIEPILDGILATDTTHALTAYGRPGHVIVVEYKTNLIAGAPWSFLEEFLLHDQHHEISTPGPTAPAVFYRAYDRGVFMDTLSVKRIGPNVLIEWPPTVPTCQLQETTSLAGTPVWTPSSAPVQQTNGVFRAVLQAGFTNRFYRLSCSP